MLKTEDLKTAYLKAGDSKYAFICWEPHQLLDTQNGYSLLNRKINTTVQKLPETMWLSKDVSCQSKFVVLLLKPSSYITTMNLIRFSGGITDNLLACSNMTEKTVWSASIR